MSAGPRVLREAAEMVRRRDIIERYRLMTGETLVDHFAAAIDDAAMTYAGATGGSWDQVVTALLRLVTEPTR